MTSISFDRAADFYDRTRSLPEAVQRQVIALLVAELQDRGTILEIGVGTGRFAIPLAVEGVEIFGIDLSAPMLGKLVERQSALTGKVRVVRGDATQLPFPTAAFGGSIACHVLHLISNWELAVEELVKVVAPGGTLLFDLGGSTVEEKALEHLVRERFSRPLHIGLDDTVMLDELLETRDAKLRLLDPITFRREAKPSRLVDRILSNQYSFTWRFTDEERSILAEDVRSLLEARFADMDSPQEFETKIQWRAYDLPPLGGS